MNQQGTPPGGFGDPSWNPPPGYGARGGAFAGGPPPIPQPGGYGAFRYRPGGSESVTATAVLSLAWETLSSSYGMLLGAALTYLAISIAAGFVPVVGVVAPIFVAPLYFSTVYLFVRVARGEDAQFGGMFEVLGRSYFQLLAINLLLSVALFVVILPIAVGAILVIVFVSRGGGTAGSSAIVYTVGGMGLIFGVLLGLFIFVRIWLAGLLFLDAPPGTLGVLESINLSWQGTRMSWGALILAQIATFVVIVMSFLLLVLPYFLVGLPFSLAVLAAAHALVFPRPSDSTCMNCGYDVSNLGLNGLCPECGMSPRAVPTG